MVAESKIQELKEKIQTLRSSVIELNQQASEYETMATQSSAQLKEHLYEPIDTLTRRFNDLANAALDVASAEEDKAKQLTGAEDLLRQRLQEYRQKTQALQSTVVELDQLASEYQAKGIQSSAKSMEHLYPVITLTERFHDLADAARHVASAEEDRAKQLTGAEDVLRQRLEKASTCSQEVEKSLKLVLNTVSQAYGDIRKLEDFIRSAEGKTKQEIERSSEYQSEIQGMVDRIAVLSAQAKKKRSEAENYGKKEEKLADELHDKHTNVSWLKRIYFVFSSEDEQLEEAEHNARGRALDAAGETKLAEAAQKRAQSEFESFSLLSSQLSDTKGQFDASLTTIRRHLENANRARESVESLQKAVGEAQNTAGMIQFEYNAQEIAKRILELQHLFTVAEDQASIDSAWDQRPREIEQGLALVAQKLKERES